jgi:exportin-7
MDSLPYLCRFQYAETAEYLTNLTDPLIAAYQSFGSAGGSSDLKQLEMLEGQLTWLVHIIGAVVRGRMNTTGNGPVCS